MKISSFILLSFIFILLLFSITTYINYRLSEDVKSNAEFLSRSTEIVRSSSRFQRNTINMVSGLRGFLLTGERYFIESYDSAVSENERILHDIEELSQDSAQIRLLREIKALNDKWTEDYTEPLRQAKLLASINDSNINYFNKIYRDKAAGEKIIQNQLQQKFREFSNWEYAIRDQRRALLASSAARSKEITLALTVISLIAAIVIVGVLISRISNRIGKMVEMADTIASGSYDVSMYDPGSDELTALSTSLNHMAKELSRNISLLQEKNEELDQFAHIVSHDLKGPLRGIDNVVSWIEEDHQQELTPKVNEYLHLIKGRVVRAENLIHGLLSYARIGKEIVPKEEVNIKELLAEVKDSVPLTENVSIDIQEMMPTTYTERIPLFQVFSNLVSNAIKYNDKQKCEIKISCKDSGNKYEFTVEDNGPGISEQYHQRIFVIFQTLKERDSFESTGVGLAIVKKILDKRSEKISLESKPGDGARFSFTWSKN
jgi:signal transduction histidine kinase